MKTKTIKTPANTLPDRIISKRFFWRIFQLSLIVVTTSKVNAQFPFVQRKVWDGPYDIKMIAAPNLDPVFINATQASSGKLLADSLITQNVIQRTGDLLNINNRYKGGSPFVQVSQIPSSAFLCTGDPDVGGCLLGLTTQSTSSSCPVIKYNGPAYVSSYVSMTYADYDSDVSTYSSSMAQLDISSCSEIEAAYLYWTGMFKGSNDDITLLDGSLNSFNGVNASTVFNTSTSSGHNTVKFKIPGGTYQTVTATAANTRNGDARYLCVADVTSMVQGTGGGQFWVANLQSYPVEGDGGSSSGWVLVVIFRSPLSPPRLISLWDGMEDISSGSNKQFLLTGLTTPSTSNFKSYVGFCALDGENIASQIDESDTREGLGFQTNAGGSYYEINPFATDQSPYKFYNKKGYPADCGESDNLDNCKTPLYDANWCSTYDGISSSRITTYDDVTDKNGNEIIRLPSNKNTLGLDAHHMKLPDGAIAPGATQATLKVFAGPQGGTTPFLSYVAIERLQPKLELTKFTDKNTTGTGTAITYTLRIKNVGNTASLGDDNIYDTLDIATDYSVGSVTSTRYVNGSLTTPAPGVTLAASAGDNLRFNLANPIQMNDSVDIVFTVNVKTYAGNTNLWDVQCKRTITNTAYIKYNTATSGVLEDKSNSDDCGIGPETKVLIFDALLDQSTTTILGPFNACSYISDPVLSHVQQELVNAGVSSSVISEFDIRNSDNSRVKTTDDFATYGSMSYFAYRDHSTAGNCQEIYEIKYNSCVLPVDLIAFTAWKEEEINRLTWSTASEENILYYIVERSGDGKEFTQIGEISSKGNSSTLQSYYFIDDSPLSGLNYYRLKHIDQDGHSGYSKVIALDRSLVNDIAIYPNPNNGDFTIGVFTSGNYRMEIMDLEGRQVYQSSGYITERHEVEINDLAKGIYLIRFYYDGNVMIKKLFVY